MEEGEPMSDIDKQRIAADPLRGLPIEGHPACDSCWVGPPVPGWATMICRGGAHCWFGRGRQLGGKAPEGKG